MIDGDDHREDGQDANARDLDGNEAGESSADEQSHEAEAGAQAETEEQPALALDRNSDEGGTIENNAEASPEEPEAPAEPETTAESEEFDGALLADDAESEDGEEAAFEEHDLGLVSDDDALPWLESSDYDDIESVDAWRITGFVVLGLVVLALLVGGIWYFAYREADGAPTADGSTIAAPEGPYKVRPEEPGGKTFEGTGDMAPAVGEGETREGRLAGKPETPEPVAAEPEKAEEPAAPTKPAATGNRIAVQVGAYRDKATAEAGWRQISRQTDALAGVEYRIVKGDADIGTVYRLQALPGDMAAARRLSQALKDDGVASQIKQ